MKPKDDPFALGGKSAGDDSDAAIAAIEFEPIRVLDLKMVEQMLLRLGYGTRAAARIVAKSKSELVDLVLPLVREESLELLEWVSDYNADVRAVLDLAEAAEARLAIAFTVAAITIDRG